MRYSKTGCTNGDVCNRNPVHKCEAASWPQKKKGNP